MASIVASFTDAWIETKIHDDLKVSLRVASFTDAWIETPTISQLFSGGYVASFTDAWIETDQVPNYRYNGRSHLLQMRGLKQIRWVDINHPPRRIFYRCVD